MSIPATTNDSTQAAPPVAPVLVRSAEAEVLVADPTSPITLLVDAEDTGGRFASNRTRFEAGSVGAPPHFHTLGTEIFFVVDGSFQVLVDEEIITLGAGDLLAVPPGVHHAFGPAPLSSADVLIIFVPGRERFEYYRLLDRYHRGEASVADIQATQERFDNHYVESLTWSSRA